RRNYYGGAVLWSPRKIREANTRLAIKERDKEQEKINRASNKLAKEKEAKRKRVKREESKKRKENKRAIKAKNARLAKE
ncbi:hypothetical protein BU23DRAFT_492649, partial [Bimuria novae-zelandiae CBS 107.79]